MERLTDKELDLLSQYADGTLSASEATRIEAALQTSEAMREHLSLLRLINETLKDTKPDPLAKNFTDQVMINLRDYPMGVTPTSFRNGVILLIGVLIAVGTALVLVANGVFDNTVTSVEPGDLEFTKGLLKNPIPTVQISGKLIVNCIIVLNIALAWIVLDRTILKPLFQRRMRVQ